MADWVPTSIAARKPFSRDGGTLWTRDIICLHTMVGSLPGSWSWASSQGTVWHFGTSGTGECWQCLPLDRRSGANLHGNHRVVAIENADHGPGFGPWNGQCGHVPPFTPAQLDKLVQLVAWLCVSLNIPPVLIPDTRPGRRGIAYHRQGIDPYRCGSCEMWSRAKGKCCPDNARIHQLVNVIIPRVRAAISGGAVPTPGPTPTPPAPSRRHSMFHLVKKAGSNRIYLIHGFTRVHLNTPAAVAEAVWLHTAAGDLAAGPNNAPKEWPAHWVDLRTPLRGDIDN